MQINGKYKLILTNENSEILDTYELEGMDLDKMAGRFLAADISEEIKKDMKREETRRNG
tara:strand:+ start:184 stop:360 length:177 start_codon:yes stop_codon:yes gene_type:complete